MKKAGAIAAPALAGRTAGPFSASCPLLVSIRSALHFLAAALDVLAEAMHRVARCQSQGEQQKGNCGNGFFHDFPFRLNE
jgi:hypothetical protein